jgi:hypothetical protein
MGKPISFLPLLLQVLLHLLRLREIFFDLAGADFLEFSILYIPEKSLVERDETGSSGGVLLERTNSRATEIVKPTSNNCGWAGELTILGAWYLTSESSLRITVIVVVHIGIMAVISNSVKVFSRDKPSKQ